MFHRKGGSLAVHADVNTSPLFKSGFSDIYIVK
ncbi:hypothetical protein FHW00_000947 [Ochrobactrum sp. P6BSIII]|jgi:hypothetical protein|nr:hypothetical protein [Ochrobactrum sp. P6BSIII]